MRQAAAFVDRKVQVLLRASLRIQRQWRSHRALLEQRHLERAGACVGLVQRVWRGHHARNQLAARHSPEVRERLSRLGAGAVRAWKQSLAAVQLQRVWRGSADRSYAAMRRVAFYNSAVVLQRAWLSYKIVCSINALCDDGPGAAVKKFLRQLKTIY